MKKIGNWPKVTGGKVGFKSSLPNPRLLTDNSVYIL